MHAATFRGLAASAQQQHFVSRRCCRSAPQQRLQAAPRSVRAHSVYPGRDREEDASPISAQALQEYFALEKSGMVDALSLENFRLKYGMKRGVDGRVQLRRSDGTWMQVKLDMELQGTMLLRDTRDGSVHVLQTDRLEQIDLSDDYLLLMMFADGAWEDQIQPIQLGNGDEVEPLAVPEQQFKDFVGVLKTLQEMEQQAEQGMDGTEIDVQAQRL